MGIGETCGDSGSDRPGFKSSLSLDFPETDPEVHVQVLYSGGKRIKRKGDGGEGSQERLSYQASDLSGQLAFNPKGRVWETEWNTSSRVPVSV